MNDLKRKLNLRALQNLFLLLSAVLLFCFSNPGFIFSEGLSLFAWISYLPIFLLVNRIPFKGAAVFGFLYGFLSYLCLCWWLYCYGFACILFVLVLYGLLFSFVFLAVKILLVKFNFLSFLTVPLFLTAFGIFRSLGFLGFSYGNIAYTQWQNGLFLTSARFVGVYGVSLFLYLFNFFSFKLCSLMISLKGRRKDLLKSIAIGVGPSAFAAFFVFLLFLCFFCFGRYLKKQENSEKFKVVLVQNASSSKSASIDEYVKDCERLVSVTSRALSENPDVELVVWPETAVVPDIYYHLNNDSTETKRKKLAAMLDEFFATAGTAFIIGNNHRLEIDSKIFWHNSALFADFTENERKIDYYDKMHLVPFTEYIPEIFKKEPLKKLMKYVPSDDFDKGEKINLFELKNGVRAGTLICFEDSFPEISAEMKKMGADFLVNISDDSWANSEACENLHLAMSAFRAAENTLPIIRSTISGKTCVIDSTGKVLESMEREVDGFLTAEVEIFRQIR